MLAQAASGTTNSPWWGIPVIAGSFALFGILLSQVIAYLNEKRKDKRRLEADVRAACRKLLALVEFCLREPQNLAELEDTENELYEAILEIQMIAPAAIAKAAKDLQNAGVGLLHEQTRTPPSRAEYGKVYEASVRTRRNLMNEIRKWMGIGEIERGEIM